MQSGTLQGGMLGMLSVYVSVKLKYLQVIFTVQIFGSKISGKFNTEVGIMMKQNN